MRTVFCIILEPDPALACRILELLSRSKSYSFSCHVAVDWVGEARELDGERFDIVFASYSSLGNSDLLSRIQESEKPSVFVSRPGQKDAVAGSSGFVCCAELTEESLDKAVVEALGAGFDDLVDDSAFVHFEFLDIPICVLNKESGRIVFKNTSCQDTIGNQLKPFLEELFEFGILESESVSMDTDARAFGLDFVEVKSNQFVSRETEFVSISLRDISKRKRLEATLKESQRKSALLARVNGAGIWTWERDRNQLSLSKECLDQLGYSSPDESTSLDAFFEAIHPEDRQGFRKRFEEVNSGSVSSFDEKFRVRHRDGAYRRIRCLAESSHDSSGNLTGLLGVNVPYPEQAEPGGKRSADAHLQEILRSRIRTLLSDQQSVLSDFEEVFRSDSGIFRELSLLGKQSRLIERLADMSGSLHKDNSPEKQNVDLGAVVEESLSVVSVCLSQKFKAQVRRLGNASVWSSNPARLRCVLAEAFLRLGLTVDNEIGCQLMVYVRATETGAGELMFEFSGRVDAKPLMELFNTLDGMTISCTNKNGRTSLRIVIASESRQLIMPRRGGRPRVLLAEDEDVLRLSIRILLDGLGYEVVVAEDGQDAVSKFMNRDSDFDLALIDLQMPGVDGYGVVSSIRTTHPQLPVIRMSGDFLDQENDLLWRADRYSTFLAKPFGVLDLEAAIGELTGRSVCKA
ncbi:response regulator [Pelagicoccus albus]|uniref:Response regulator n=1 Tax=Pelagicoccus albus TaxID=415222 RepID=A0A7X1B9F0_9BACT|nr:response regulator [Pelagicoccus albus]MBC2608111.1 response regulator [Pelagicoccus albus]